MQRTIGLAAGACLLFGIGAVVGRWSMTEATSPRGAATAAAPATARLGAVRPAALEAVAAPCGHAHAAVPGERPAPPAAPIDLAPALAAARVAASAGPDDAHVQEAVKAAADGLFTRLAADSRALAEALRQFRTLTDRPALELLASVLGRLRDPEVEGLALAVAAGAGDPQQRLAALDILDALDAPGARRVALDVLARDTDPALRRAALHALPAPVAASEREAREVGDQLGQVVRADPDPETRRRAAIALGRWASSPGDVEPIRQGLLRDADPAVRAGCAYALELAGQRGAATRRALVQVVGATGEERLVRENAWKALGALGPLAPRERAAWQAYARAREATLEGGPGG